MTIKLKFELSGVSVIKNNNSSCVLRLNINDSRYLLGLKSGNNVNTDVINGTDSFNVQGGSSSVVLSAIEHIDITCSEKSAEQAERLINLRNKLIQNGGSNDINK
jgi:hypothetical protein